MTPTRQKRLRQILLLLFTLSASGFLVLKGLQANMTYFITPSDTKRLQLTTTQSYRIGGTVKMDSVEQKENGISTRFQVTDCNHDVTVEYTGLLPDLFREGQGVIADGKINESGIFIASIVLAKHDENYVPKELASHILERQANHCQTGDMA